MFIVLFDSDLDQSNHLTIEGDDKFLCLTPSSKQLIKRNFPKHKCLDSADYYGSREHTKTVEFVTNALDEYDAAIEHLKLPQAFAKFSLRHGVFHLSSIVGRLYWTIPDEPHHIFEQKSKKWKKTQNIEEAINVLLPKILDAGTAHIVESASVPFPKYFNFLAGLLAFTKGNASRLVLAPSKKLKTELNGILLNHHYTIAKIELTKGSFKEYLGLLKALFNSKNFSFTCSPEKLTKKQQLEYGKLSSVIETGFSHKLMKAGWSIYSPLFSKNLNNHKVLQKTAKSLIKVLNINMFASYEANGWKSAALLDAANDSEINSVVVNHNSQPPTENNDHANFLLKLLYSHRNGIGMTTRVFNWSQSPLDSSDCNQHIEFYRANYPKNIRNNKSKFRILFAGNYQNWHDYFPYITQTSQEFVESIGRLIKAVTKMDDAELHLRIRPKTEVNASTIESMVDACCTNIFIQEASGDFLEELAKADLMVAYFSTTVEQALQLGVPVLLLGDTERYVQFSSQQNINACRFVYSAKNEENLQKTLAEIVNEHHYKSLDISEFNCYGERIEASTLEENLLHSHFIKIKN